MADTGRESLGHKVEAAGKPDSMKTNTEHAKDLAKGHADKTAAHVEPEGQKSYTQKAGDALTTNHDETGATARQHESFVDKVKDKLHLGHKEHH